MEYTQKQEETIITSGNIKRSSVGTNQQARPYPLIFGVGRVGGVYLDNVFSLRSVAITSRVQTGKSSSETVTNGFNYFASYAQGVCIGEVRRVRSVLKNNEATGGSSEITQDLTNIGVGLSRPIQFLRGSRTQTTHPALARTGNIHPPYRGICYFVIDDVLLGQHPTPFNFEFILEVVPRALVLDPLNESDDPNLDDDSYHFQHDGMLAPEIIYLLITNQFYGAKSNIDIDKQSFIDACQRLREEGLFTSYVIDSSVQADKAIKELLNIIDASVTNINGRLTMILNRESDNPTIINSETLTANPINKTPNRSGFTGLSIELARVSDELESETYQFRDEGATFRYDGENLKSYSFKGIRNEEVLDKIGFKKFLDSTLESGEQELRFPRHLTPQIGDTIQSEGFNLIVNEIIENGASAKVRATTVFRHGETSLTQLVKRNDIDLSGSTVDIQLARVSTTTADDNAAYFLVNRQGQNTQVINIFKTFDDTTISLETSLLFYHLLGTISYISTNTANNSHQIDYQFSRDFEDEEFEEYINDGRLADLRILAVDSDLVAHLFTISSASFNAASNNWRLTISSPTINIIESELMSNSYIAPDTFFIPTEINQDIWGNSPNFDGDNTLTRTFIAQSSNSPDDIEDANSVTYDSVNDQLSKSWGGSI